MLLCQLRSRVHVTPVAPCQMFARWVLWPQCRKTGETNNEDDETRLAPRRAMVWRGGGDDTAGAYAHQARGWQGGSGCPGSFGSGGKGESYAVKNLRPYSQRREAVLRGVSFDGPSNDGALILDNILVFSTKWPYVSTQLRTGKSFSGPAPWRRGGWKALSVNCRVTPGIIWPRKGAAATLCRAVQRLSMAIRLGHGLVSQQLSISVGCMPWG